MSRAADSIWTKNIKHIQLVLAVAGGCMLNAFYGGIWFNKSVPERSAVEQGFAAVNQSISDMKKYVDAKTTEATAASMKYTDDKFSASMQELKAYSDMNYQRMTTKQEAMAAKLDMLIDVEKEHRGKKF